MLKLELSFTLLKMLSFNRTTNTCLNSNLGRNVIFHQPWFPGNKASCWGGFPYHTAIWGEVVWDRYNLGRCMIQRHWRKYTKFSSRVRNKYTALAKKSCSTLLLGSPFFQEMPGICTIFWRFSCAAGWNQVAEDLVHQLQGDGSLGWQFFSTATMRGLSETLIQPQCQGCNYFRNVQNWFFRLLTSFANDLENMTWTEFS